MTPILGGLAVHIALATAAPAQVVAPTGHYVYALRPSVRIADHDIPAKTLRKAAAVFWPGEDRIAAVLAANGIADESRLQFGTVLRVPAPSQASAMSRCFEQGLRLEVDGENRPTVHVDCDPCETPAGHTEGAETALALRVTDDRGHIARVGLDAIPDADGGAPHTGGTVTDLRAWNLPDGDVLIAVRSQDATGGGGRGVAGGISFYRSGAGPRTELLASLPGDRIVSGAGASGHDECLLSAALEGKTFVLTVARTRRESGAERRADQSIVRHSNEVESRQRLEYDARHRMLDVGPVVEIARRHKRWSEGEPEPAAFTEDPVRH